MNFFPRLGIIALAAFSTPAIAEDPATDAPSGPSARVLDDYTGCYDAAHGIEFVVVREGEQLAIDVPVGYGALTLRLHATAERESFATGDAARVVFVRDAAGAVTGLAFRRADAEREMTASKARLLRGIVTIDDIDPAAHVATF